MATPKYDSPRWSYFHGCSVHKGQVPPCPKCIAEGHPDLKQLDPPSPSTGGGGADPAHWDYYRSLLDGNDVYLARPGIVLSPAMEEILAEDTLRDPHGFYRGRRA